MKALAFLLLLLTHYCFAQNHFYGTLIDEQTGQSILLDTFLMKEIKGLFQTKMGNLNCMQLQKQFKFESVP